MQLIDEIIKQLKITRWKNSYAIHDKDVVDYILDKFELDEQINYNSLDITIYSKSINETYIVIRNEKILIRDDLVRNYKTPKKEKILSEASFSSTPKKINYPNIYGKILREYYNYNELMYYYFCNYYMNKIYETPDVSIIKKEPTTPVIKEKEINSKRKLEF